MSDDPARRNGRAIGELVQRLGAAPTQEERAELRTMLVGMGAEAVAPLLRALNGARERSARRALRDALVALDRVGIPLIGEMIGDERWFVVRNMVDILGEVRGPEALEHFARTVRHPDPRVRRETVLALTRLGNEEAVPLLAVALDDREASVRAAAALGLGLTHSPEAVAYLLAHLRRESDGEAERETIRALGRLGDPSGVPALAERAAAGGWLSRHSPASRAEAARALGSIGGERARGALRELLHDRSEAVREAAAEALR